VSGAVQAGTNGGDAFSRQNRNIRHGIPIVIGKQNQLELRRRQSFRHRFHDGTNTGVFQFPVREMG
jgi:hypothetical protein